MNAHFHGTHHSHGMAVGLAAYLSLACVCLTPVFAGFAPETTAWMWWACFAVMYWHFSSLWMQEQIVCRSLWMWILRPFGFPLELIVVTLRTKLQRKKQIRARKRARPHMEAWS